MRFVLYVGLVFMFHAALAQQWSFEYWHEGKIVLDVGDTVRGKIKYSIDQDIIQLESNAKLQSFTARKIVFFEIFDALTGRYRQFYSIPFSLNGSYKSPTFFELLTEGKLTLLAREALENQTTNTGFYGYGGYNRIVLVNKYYTVNDKGDIQAFSGKRNDLMLIMRSREDEIKRFMKANRLDTDRTSDLVRIFAYYNTLFNK